MGIGIVSPEICDLAPDVPAAGEGGHGDGPAVFHHGGVEIAAVGGEAAGDDAVVGACAGVLAADRARGQEGGEAPAGGLAVRRGHLGRVDPVEADAVAADVEGVAVDDAAGPAADRLVRKRLDAFSVGGGPGEDEASQHAEGETQAEDRGLRSMLALVRLAEAPLEVGEALLRAGAFEAAVEHAGSLAADGLEWKLLPLRWLRCRRR